VDKKQIENAKVPAFTVKLEEPQKRTPKRNGEPRRSRHNEPEATDFEGGPYKSVKRHIVSHHLEGNGRLEKSTINTHPHTSNSWERREGFYPRTVLGFRGQRPKRGRGEKTSRL